MWITVCRTRVTLKRDGAVLDLVPPPTKVNNLIFGRTWTDSPGEMVMTNMNTGDKVVLYFQPCGWFGYVTFSFFLFYKHSSSSNSAMLNTFYFSATKCLILMHKGTEMILYSRDMSSCVPSSPYYSLYILGFLLSVYTTCCIPGSAEFVS